MNILPARILRIQASAFGLRRSMHLWVSVPKMRGATNEEHYLGRDSQPNTIPFNRPRLNQNPFQLRI